MNNKLLARAIEVESEDGTVFAGLEFTKETIEAMKLVVGEMFTVEITDESITFKRMNTVIPDE